MERRIRCYMSTDINIVVILEGGKDYPILLDYEKQPFYLSDLGLTISYGKCNNECSGLFDFLELPDKFRDGTIFNLCFCGSKNIGYGRADITIVESDDERRIFYGKEVSEKGFIIPDGEIIYPGSIDLEIEIPNNPNKIIVHSSNIVKSNPEVIDCLRELNMGGEIYRHFKGMYVIILGSAIHTETEEELVIYRHIKSDNVFARPKEMFFSEVDHEKYPNVTQKMRFEKITLDEYLKEVEDNEN